MQLMYIIFSTYVSWRLNRSCEVSASQPPNTDNHKKSNIRKWAEMLWEVRKEQSIPCYLVGLNTLLTMQKE